MPQMRPYARSVWTPRRRVRPADLGVTFVLLVVLGWAAVSEHSPLASKQLKGSKTSATITHVIDGDTFTARGADGTDLGRVRILGIDAPELARDGRPQMCGAAQAKQAATTLLQGEKVTLVEDSHPRSSGRDTYGRLLRYVEIEHHGQALDVSEHLINRGHAVDTSRRTSHDRHLEYTEAEEDAVKEQRGIWGRC